MGIILKCNKLRRQSLVRIQPSQVEVKLQEAVNLLLKEDQPLEPRIKKRLSRRSF